MRRGGGRMGRRKTLLLWVLCTVVPLSAIHGPGGSDSHYPMASPPKIEEMPPAMQEVIPSAQPSYTSDHVGVDHKWPRVIPPSIESPAPNLPLGSGPAKFPITSPVMPAAAPPKEISSYLSPDNPPHLKDSSLMLSPAVHEVKYPSNTTNPPLTSEPSVSPAISPTPNESKNLSNTTHAPLESHPASSFVISHTPNEASNPSDTTPSPLISHLSPSPVISPAVHEIKYPSYTTHPPLISEPSASPAISPTPTESKNLSTTTHAPLESHPASSFVISSTPNEASNLSDTTPSPLISHPRLSPVISPAPHELKNPSYVTHAPVTSHPGSSPVISPAPNGVKNPLNTAPAPLTSYLSPSPVVSPVPHEVNNPSNITHAPVTSHPNSSPTISPVPNEVTNPSNTTPAPSTPQPSPPVTSPTRHELKNTSNTAPAPSISHHSPSPAMSPLLHQMKNPSNITPAPSTSHPSPFPMISPTPHEVENSSNTKHARLTSHPSFPPVVSPKPHDAKNSPNGTYAHVAPHPQPPAGRLHSPASSPSTTIHQRTAKRSVGNPAPSPFSVLPPSSHHPVEGPVISTAPLHPPVLPKDRRRHHAPPLFVQGPSFSPIQAPFSSTVREGAPAPSPSSMIPSRRNESEPVPSPILSPSGPFSRRPTAPSPQPVWSLPPPTSSLGPVHSPVHSPSESFSRKPGAPSPHPVWRLPSPPPNYSPVHSPSESFSRKPGAPSPHPVWRLPSPPPNYGPVHSPVHSPSESFSRKPGAPSPHPVWILPSPPPNYDCNSLTCSDPLANSPPGSPCICVLPIKVGLRLGVALYTFFPLVSELAQEIAAGIFMKQSQVRIMGANATDEEPEKTIVLIYLVPLGKYFDNTTAFLIYERFWHKQVVIEASYFGDYDVLYVHYPGLPPSPPAAPSGINVDNAAYGSDNNGRTIHPLGVDVRKQKEKQLSGSLIAIIVLSSIIALILFIGAAWLLVLKYRDHAHLPASTSQSLLPTLAKQSATGPMVYGSGPNSVSASFNSSIATYTGSAKTFTLAEIERATKKFDNSRIIGEGGFGRVYQGTIDDGTRVAVKVLKREDQQGGREFLAEVEMLSRLHHRNLVKLIGICTEDIHCLVYELIPNGSVESHLHGVDKETAPLDWNARVKVALGAARGLAYLHEDSSPCVIHRDFKSSNILLEHDFTPKVSDFGLARTAMDGGNEHISTRVMGTFGYVAPEYAMTGHLLVKSDVYSYGVVLLELLTGRKPVDMLQPPGQENLVAWARPLLTSMDGLVAIIDSSLGTDVPFDSVAKVAAIASMCVQPEVSHRPFMGEVVQALKLVCNESDEYRPSGSCSQEEISAQGTDIRISTGLDLEAGRGLSSSDIFSTSARFTKDASGSFRRHSSSGPLRTGRSSQVWQRDGDMSAGSMSEHGVAPRSMTSFEGRNKWP